MTPEPLRRERPGRRLLYLIEAGLAWPLYGLVWLLPLDWASALGAVLARAIGPRLNAHRRARRNLARAFPEKSDAEIEAITRAMWDNLGRVALEYPQLRRIEAFTDGGRIELVGAEHLHRARERGGPGIFFGGHLGNWEVLGIPLIQCGLNTAVIYREANNPYLEPLLRRARRPNARSVIPKGAEGARRTLAQLRQGGFLWMLVDQKMNDGIPVPYFGRDVMTAPALARFAYKFDLPVVPVRVERFVGARFRVTFHPPMKLPKKGTTAKRVAEMMGRVNATIEGWVRERPEQWLWVHHRWPDDGSGVRAMADSRPDDTALAGAGAEPMPGPLRRERPWRRILYLIEAGLAWPFYGLVWLLPLDWASALGAVLARAIGPRLAAHRRARRNLARAFPEKSDAEIDAIARGMWDNLGRVALEYPQLRRIKAFSEGARIEIVGAEHLERVRERGGPGIFFAGHLGNWEVPSIAVLHGGVPITLIYRAANNPFVEPLVRRTRRPSSVSTIAKGPAGARQTLALLRKGGVLGMLVDQKMNDGIPVPFFGRDAMTAPALAQFALKYQLPVVPVQVERLKGARFRVTFHPPLKLPKKGATATRVAQVMGRVNALIEGWVRERPEQWLWAHRRWPD